MRKSQTRLQCSFTEAFHFISFSRYLLSTSCEPATLLHPVMVVVVAVVMEVREWVQKKERETLPE